MSDIVFQRLVLAWILLAVVAFLALLRMRAPYGRHLRPGWGPRTSARLGWILMETPSLVVMVLLFVSGGRFDDPAGWTLVALWTAHYVHRSWIWPFRARLAGRTMPWSVVLMAIVFNVVNAGINGSWIFRRSTAYGTAWVASWPFILGVGLFLSGMALNVVSDNRLMRLRAADDAASAGRYAIPRGGAFEWISCPNYLGEIVEWIGWAVANWCLPGAAFAVWTAANLTPRAIAHHRWYRETYPDYPPKRKALIPGVL